MHRGLEAVGNFSISRKLAVGFACVLTSAAALAVTVFFATQAVDTAARVNTAAHSVVIDIERAAAAQYDQAHTARGYIITQVDRHAKLYAEAGQLFDQQIAAARRDAETNAAALAAVAKLEAANTAWRKEIGDPEIKWAGDSKTLEQAVEIARSARSSDMMRGFRSALEEARDTIANWSRDAEQVHVSTGDEPPRGEDQRRHVQHRGTSPGFPNRFRPGSSDPSTGRRHGQTMRETKPEVVDGTESRA